MAAIIAICLFIGNALAATTAGTTPAGPTFTGSPATCNKWYTIVTGDTCSTVEQAFGVSHDQFIAWNPAVSRDCATNFWLGQSYCVGVGSSTPTTTADSTPAGPTFTGSPANCNKWWTIKTGNTCATVETAFGITHAQFLSWNPAVSSDCATNFWLGQSYCVGVGAASPSTTTSRPVSTTADPTPAGPTFTGSPANCNKWYTVKDGNTCDTIERAFGITHAQFLAFNPAISSDCATNFWLGQSYCVGVGIGATTTTAAPTSTFINATTSYTSIPNTEPYSTLHPITDWNITATSINTAWPPDKTQAGQPANCNQWHLVRAVDTCDSIRTRYAFPSEEAFYDWNPALGRDCYGLYYQWWVCVGVKPESSLTLNYPDPSIPVVVPDPTSYTYTAFPTINSSFVPMPTQAGLVSGCQAFYYVKGGDRCDSILQQFKYITQDQLLSWNPSLGGASCPNLWSSYYLCVGYFPNGLPLPPTVAVLPSPVKPGIAGNCVRWYNTTVGDTCSSVASIFRTFTEDDYIRWNPDVYEDCSNIQVGFWYCIGVPGTPTSTVTVIPTSTISKNPQQTGIAINCNKVWQVSSTDTCESIAAQNGITVEDFYSWNPAVGSSSCLNLFVDYEVCVGIGSTSGTVAPTAPSSTRRSTSTPASTTKPPSSVSSTQSATRTSTSAPAVSTPSPIQAGMVAGCRRFYFVRAGDGCWAIANSAGILLDDFYAWNPAVGTECGGLWSDVYVCIGLQGPTTTISGGPPVPT